MTDDDDDDDKIGRRNVIPFGKYKGRLIEEVLVDDPNYLQWLTGQEWFRDRFVNLYQVIINRGAEAGRDPGAQRPSSFVFG